MSKEELIILKYINKYKQIKTDKIYKHFSRINYIKKIFFRKRSAEKFSRNSINGCLWCLEVNNRYIIERGDEYQITDRGEIEAYSYVIELREIWKNRIIGFFLGIISAVIASNFVPISNLIVRVILKFQ